MLKNLSVKVRLIIAISFLSLLALAVGIGGFISLPIVSAIVFGLVIGAGVGLWQIRAIVGPLHEAIEIAQKVALGDLTQNIVVSSRDETGQLLQALKDMNDSLLRIVGEVRVGTDTIATASSEIASGNLDLSQRTESQASS